MTIFIRGSFTTSLREDILAAQNRVATAEEYVNRREYVAGTGNVVTRTIVADGLATFEGDNVFFFNDGAVAGGLTRGVILTGATNWNADANDLDNIYFSGTFVVGNGSNIVSFTNHGYFNRTNNGVFNGNPTNSNLNLLELNEPIGANYDLYRVADPVGLNSWTGFAWNEATFNNAVGAYAAGNFAPLDNLLNNETYDYFGNGRVQGGNFADRLVSDGGFVNISGGGGDDYIAGSVANGSILNGDGGNDRIDGGDGNEFINGGTDNDFLVGGLGLNNMNGGAGNDVFVIGVGTDYITDGQGFDILALTNASEVNFESGVFTGDATNDIFQEVEIERFDGSIGNDLIILTIGGTGYREVNGGNGVDILGGNADINRIDGGAGNDFLYGRDGNDVLLGGTGIDQLNGDANNDFLQGGTGNDALNGGGGSDTADFSTHFGDWSNGWTIDVIAQTARTSYIASGLFLFTTETDTMNSVENVVGSAGADTIFSNGTGDVKGGNGNDTLVLAATVSSAFTISGQTESNDTVDMNLGTSKRTSSFTTGIIGVIVYNEQTVTFSGIETLRAGVGNDNVNGSAFSDGIFGEDGADNLKGQSGNDIVDGGNGADNLFGGTGADQLIGGDGTDYARYDDANHGNLIIRLDAANLNTGAAAGDTYTSIEGLVGGLGNDIVVGNGLANLLFGGGGNDLIYGQGGADYLNGGAGTNQLYGGAGADAHVGGTGIDYARYDDFNWGNLVISLAAPASNTGAAAGDTYTGIEGVVGGLGNDVIIGNTVNNYLFGGGGADYINGFTGSDYLSGGAGADRFAFTSALNASTNVDRIVDFATGLDDFNLAKVIFASIGTTLDATELRLGAAAADANDYLIYNNANGQLFYDANGSGAGGQTLFATLNAGTVLNIGDFVMV
ncbi:MAG: beta strand repeat-containing protein [Rhizobiaceae bacterium]